MMRHQQTCFITGVTFVLLISLASALPASAEFIPAQSYSYIRAGGHYSEADVLGGEQNGWGASPGFSKELSEYVHFLAGVGYTQSDPPTATADVITWSINSGVGMDFDLGRSGSLYVRTQALWFEEEFQGIQDNEVVGLYTSGIRFQLLDSLEMRTDVAYIDHDEDIAQDASTDYQLSWVYYPNPNARQLVGGISPFYRSQDRGDVDIVGLDFFWFFK